MSVPADLEAGLVAYLKAQASVSALVGTRVFAGELHPNETQNMPRKALLVRLSGGVSLTGESKLRYDTQRFDLFAFGETPLEAGRTLATAGFELRALENGTWAGCRIFWVNSAGGRSQGVEPGTEWPRHFQSFQAMHGLIHISA
ncbi:MAG: DUF3168 domain-containing protein [Pseudomonadota bacterium]